MKKAIPILLAFLLLAGCAALTEAPAEPDQPTVRMEPTPEEPGTPPELPVYTPAAPETGVPETVAPEPSVPAATGEPDAVTPSPSVAQQPTAPDIQPETQPPVDEPVPYVGFSLEEDGLYYVQEDGTYLQNGCVGELWFDGDGRYTSGSTDLDAAVDAVLQAADVDLCGDQETQLKTVYAYIRDHYTYVGVHHYDAGTTEWLQEAALFIAQNSKSNCYGFSALFACCARRLGYQARVVAGHEYNATNDHAWVMIDWSDGETYLFDVQLEYAYLYLYDRGAIDMFKVAPDDDGSYNGKEYFFP